MTDEQVYELKISDIEISDENVRSKVAVDDELKELAESIKLLNQLQPVVLRGDHGKPPYELIIGQRRFTAMKKILNKKTIKAVFAGTMTDTNAKIRSLVENMCRAELSYEDTADAVTELYKANGRDDRKVAKVTGLALRHVRQYIYIKERASDAMKKKMRDRKVTPADVHRALKAASDDVAKADELVNLIEKHKLDSHQKKRLVEIGEQHPRMSAEEIFKRAQPPALEENLVVRLPERIRKALVTAADELAMAPDELAAKALEEWLSTKGFMSK